MQTSFYQLRSFNAACSGFFECLALCLEDVTPVFHKLLLYLVFLLYGGGKQFRNPQPSVCSECSFGLRWQRKQLPHMCCHSYVPQTIQWQLILPGSCHLWSGSSSRQNLSSWNEGCHLQWLNWAGNQWHLSKYTARRWTWCHSTSTLGCITATGWDRTNKTYCTGGARILLFKTIASITGGQHIVLWAKRQHSEGCMQGVHQTSREQKKKEKFLLSEPDDTEDAGGTETNTKPNLILNNISHPLCGDICISFNTPGCSRKVFQCSFVPPTNRLLHL